LAGSGAANPGLKVTSIVAGMVAGADSVESNRGGCQRFGWSVFKK
jgi:hypothetical protein